MTTIQTRIKRGFVDTPDGQIHYRIGGTGKPLLLLHQSPRSSNEYLEMMAILVKEKTVVAMDTMGYGDSDKRPRPFLVEDYAKTVVMLLDSLGIRKASIAGHHTGAFIATEVAAAYPEMVDKLVLSMPFYLNPDARKWMSSVKEWQITPDGGSILEHWKGSISRLGDTGLAYRRFLDILKAGVESEYPLKAVAKYQQAERLPLIKSPTLLLWGTADMERLDKYGLRVSEYRHLVEEAIPRNRSLLVPDASIYFPTQMPDEFARLILDFLDDSGV